jgi:hypothetical protein
MFEHQCRKGVTTCGDCKKEIEIVHPKVPKIEQSIGARNFEGSA